MPADWRGAITLIAGAGVVIVRTGGAGRLEAVSRAGGVHAIAGLGYIAEAHRWATERAGVAGRMLAGWRGAITLIEGADVAIIGTGCPGHLEAVSRTDAA